MTKNKTKGGKDNILENKMPLKKQKLLGSWPDNDFNQYCGDRSLLTVVVVRVRGGVPKK